MPPPSANAASIPLPEPAELPEHTGLPDPLRPRAGEPIETIEQWRGQRRPELLTLFQHYVYGSIPPAPPQPPTRAGALRELMRDPAFLDDRAELRELEWRIEQPTAVRLRVLLVLPKGRAAPAPAFLGLNRLGNHTVVSHSGVALPENWVPEVRQDPRGAAPSPPSAHRASDADRGSRAHIWPVHTLIERGYALATFYPGDVSPDDAQFHFAYRNARGEDTTTGTIAAWAWGAMRAMDVLETVPEIDPRRVALLGHSRRGKTSMLAAACDERFAMVIPHQAGSVGTAPARVDNAQAETIKRVNEVRPHWFSDRFKRFNDRPQRLPVDQHALIALAAPRPVLASNAEDDAGANPWGQFRMLQAADPVYHLHGATGVADAAQPQMNALIGGELGFFLRPGGHSTTDQDWQAFLQFADRHMGKPGGRAREQDPT